MDADTLKLKAIFRKDSRYEVPIFQRPYVWNEDEHWQLLWDDLLEVLDEVTARRNGERNGRPLRPHFLGAMVLEQLPTPTRKVDIRQIIDGQQRLITLQLLLAAGRESAKKLNSKKQIKYFERLLFNDEDVIEHPELLVKLWPIEPDRGAFLKAVAPHLIDERVQVDNGHRVLKAYRFFRDRIQEWVMGNDDDSPEVREDRLDTLTTTLWDHLRIVVIDLDRDEDDSQMIFETLNARGTPLLHADLIKNYTFREAETQGLDVAQLHRELWAPFDEEDWREAVTQGRVSRPKVDVLITHWLTMRTSQEIRLRRLFHEFQKHLDESKLDVTGILSSLARYGEIYSDLMAGEGPGHAPLFFHRLNVMDTTTAIPVLLWLLGQPDVPTPIRDRTLHAIESWLVRRMLARESSRAYNRTFLDMLKLMKDSSPEMVDRVVVDFLRTREGGSYYWPDDDTLREHMQNTPYWSRINQRRLRMVFRALEDALRGTGFSEERTITGSLHIEHILPREWAHHWPLPGERPVELERIERNEAKDLIGNLTIITDRLNPRISNGPWEKKREAISEFSTLRLNRKLVSTNPERWDEESIQRRGEELAEITSRVWPGPESDHWGDPSGTHDA